MHNNIEKPGEELGYLLAQVYFLKQRAINAALKELDITYMQFVILAGAMELGDDGRIVTQQTISDERRLDKAMVSNVVKTLIAKGYMRRSRHPSDKRAFTLTLTVAGTGTILRAKKIAHEVDDIFFEGTNKTLLRETLTKLLLRNDNSNHE